MSSVAGTLRSKFSFVFVQATVDLRTAHIYLPFKGTESRREIDCPIFLIAY
jgi:hypothetical protein